MSAAVYAFIALGLVVCARSFLTGGLTPGHLWAYAWAFAWMCQALLGYGFLLDKSTVAFVAVCNLAFIVGAFVSAPRSHDLGSRVVLADTRKELRGSPTVRVACAAASVLIGIVALNFGLKDIGHPGVGSIFAGTFVDFGSSLVEIKSSLSDGGVWAMPAAITVATTLLTCAAVLSGIEFAQMKRKTWRWPIALTVGTMTFAFLVSAGTGIRNNLLVSIIVFAASYLATKIYLNGAEYRLSRRTLAGSAVVSAMFLVWVVVVQSARRGDYSFARLGATLDYLRSWFAGYLPALSQWSYDADLDAGAPGVSLLRGILTPLGIAEGEGFSEQIRVIAIGDGATSNAMTIFRVLLLDFGFAGSIIVCAVMGFVCQRVYQHVANGSVLAMVPLAAIYAGVVYSVNYWFFAYGSRIAGTVLAFMVVVWSLHTDALGKDSQSLDTDTALRRRRIDV